MALLASLVAAKDVNLYSENRLHYLVQKIFLNHFMPVCENQH